MYQIVSGSTHGLRDVERFIDTLDAGVTFAAGPEVYIARAPGRLDLMGGIADYSGSLVLQLPIAEAALVAVQRDKSPVVTIVSLDAGGGGERRQFSMALSDLRIGSKPIDYLAAQSYFNREPARHWAAYVAGAFTVLMRERGARFEEGARILISSAVPEGKGVSSSAAIEVATMQAIAAAFDIDLSPLELALLCQKVENLIVGAPCGVMDQMTAVFGEVGRLMALLCQPAQLQGTLAIPDGIGVWGIDSGVRHYVSGADYTSVRVGAFMGYRMICEMAGMAARKQGKSIVVEDSRWHGYLANVTPSEFEEEFAAKLPERISGSEFLAHFEGITDSVTQIDPRRSYPVRAATAHPIYEHFRVRAFAELLSRVSRDWRSSGEAEGALGYSGGGESSFAEKMMPERGAGGTPAYPGELLGELMYQSHASYSACGLGFVGTDLLVELVRGRAGLYGAKITGGGSGGTVAVLGSSDAYESVLQVAEEYERRTGHRPHVFSGSSPGSAVFGCLSLRSL
jgi:L-arabinokinase